MTNVTLLAATYEMEWDGWTYIIDTDKERPIRMRVRRTGFAHRPWRRLRADRALFARAADSFREQIIKH